MSGRLIGIGVGPGDPDLLTVKAVKAIAASPVVAFFAKEGKRGIARQIVDPWVTGGQIEVPLYYPMTTELPFDDPAYVDCLRRFYQAATDRLGAHLAEGRDVALLAEGDPLFYGSFMHLFVRLRVRFPTEIIPGVSGMAGCWAAAGQPMTWGDDVLTILPGTLPEADLAARLQASHAAVVMKLGRNFAKVRAAIARAGLTERAIYVERGTMAGETVMALAEKTGDEAPYFSLILVPGDGRRP